MINLLLSQKLTKLAIILALLSSNLEAVIPSRVIELKVENKPMEVAKIEELSPILGKIAYCESRNRHFNEKGEVLRGVVNPKDIGLFQINEFYHGDKAKELGLDIYTEEGNIAYAKWLYEEQGLSPWKWSRDCWG